MTEFTCVVIIIYGTRHSLHEVWGGYPFSWVKTWFFKNIFNINLCNALINTIIYNKLQVSIYLT